LNQDSIFKFNEIEIPALVAKLAQEEMEQKARSKKEKKRDKSDEKIQLEETSSQKDLIITEKEVKSERKKRAAYSVSTANF